MGGPLGARPTRVRQRVCISAGHLHATRPLGVQRRVIRVRHDDLVAKVFEAAGHPLTLRRRLHEDPRLWSPELVPLGVTDHPAAAWAAQQIVHAFPNETALAYLL